MTIRKQYKFPNSVLKQMLGKEPMERAVICHICLDTAVISPVTNNTLGRPWLTILMDEYSKRILAFDLSMESPSYVSIMMVVRECVRINKMLPKNIVLTDDDRKVFNNMNLDTLLSAYYIQKITYPKHFCEKLFTNVSKLIERMEERCRSPWYFDELNLFISSLLYEVYDQQMTYMGTCPRGIFNSKSTSRRLPPRAEYDQHFIILCLPQIELRIVSGKGIRFNNIYYWTRDFLNPNLSGRKVMVKFDPQDINNVYAYLDNNWKKLSILFFN
ncbi:Mu transposase C-terminal domain-containing protein [Halalkalibacter akibai]|uniref:Transposase n=1 Tax=Halalkalibacter akibai (strain ATCC 43226 / DSM 21942 / CIP 109018 / JCM 9157 / 1139) TaxID=1236973 RepID=W4QP75_HALA3|nr:Mu transposase C-terminal domain-containing protein [Halalkalibacter akibai]GAE33149.1 transposase [Halalkalibacter akibai JCM 9157]